MPNNLLISAHPFVCALQAFAYWAMIVQNDFVDTTPSAESFNVSAATVTLLCKYLNCTCQFVQLTEAPRFKLSANYLPCFAATDTM
jgi:hypothetical protein